MATTATIRQKGTDWDNLSLVLNGTDTVIPFIIFKDRMSAFKLFNDLTDAIDTVDDLTVTIDGTDYVFDLTQQTVIYSVLCDLCDQYNNSDKK